MNAHSSSRVGIVVIGRNEGSRLRVCLRSIDSRAYPCVYVDSGSTDGSVELAASLNVATIQLPTLSPFTAARARNAGFAYLHKAHPELEFVQFVDGDCELAPGWLSIADSFLDTHSELAVVCGRLRERYPERSIYNMLCDREWDAPLGKVNACGGNALVRIAAFQKASGFREDLIAGEEPELCVRLRADGWAIWRLGEDMAWHDAAMTRFAQWWVRRVRAGYAFTQGAYLHGAPPERHGVRQSRSAVVWGLVIPVTGVIALLLWGAPGALVFAVFPVQIARLTVRDGPPYRSGLAEAFYTVLGKFPEALGYLRFQRARFLGAAPRLIEYK